jgi:lysozyme
MAGKYDDFLDALDAPIQGKYDDFLDAPDEIPIARTMREDTSIGRTILDQGMQGATFGFADEVTDRIGAGIASLATGEKYGELLNEARDRGKNRLQQQFEQNPVTAISANVGGSLLTGGAAATTKAGAAVGNSLRGGGTLARIGKGTLAGAASGGLYGAGTSDEGKRLEGATQGALIGGTIGGAIPAVGATASKVKQAVIPYVDDALKPLVKRARDFGIPLRVDQISPTRFRKTVQKVSQEVPLSGANSFEQTQRQAFNKALANTIGQKSDNLGPDTINTFLKDSSEKFGNVLAGKTVKVGGRLSNSLDNIVLEARNNITDDYANIVARKARQIKADLGDVAVSGEKLSSLRSNLVKSLPSVAGDARAYVSEMIDTIDDIASKSLSAKEVAQLSAARREWRNYKTIEPLLEKSTDGFINPVDLMNRVAASKYIKSSRAAFGKDDLVDLARIGKELLPKAGGSDTFQKVGLGAAGTAAVLEPTTALLTGGGIAANRVFQKGYNTSQRLIDAAIKQSRPTGAAVTPLLSAPAGAAAGALSGVEAPAIGRGMLPMQPKEPTRITITPQQRGDINNEDNMVNDSLLKTITKAEGERDKVYKDTVGKRTIGIGFNMDSPNSRVVWKNAGVKTNFDDALNGKARITKDEIQSLLRTTYETAEKDARKLIPNFDKHPENVQNAIVEMSFQLGLPGLSGFKRTLNAIKKGEYSLAAKYLKQSKYATQTPSRVKRIAETLTA